MKKSYIIMAAIASLALVSCSNEEFVGEDIITQNSNDVIGFRFDMQKTTRGGVGGSAAAELLGNHFYVTGTKGTEGDANPTPNLVFDNYLVQFGANTAGTTESNTANWEYVGITPDGTNYVKLSSLNRQTIKYWDYSVPQYDFLAFSTGTYKAGTTGNETTKTIGVTAMKYGTALANSAIAYTFDVPSADAIKQAYITDITEVAKANYGKEVQLKFKSLGSKVRVALYETVPGYSVKDVVFYKVDGTTTFTDGDNDDTNDEEFKSAAAALISANTYGLPVKGTIEVYFPHVGNDNASKADYNMAAATVTAATDGSVKTKDFGGLDNYASNQHEEASGKYLGRSLPQATFAGDKNASYYQTVFPVSTSSALTLRVDYTLVSVDGSGEEIHIYGAKAVVPATYTKWLPNYAYTYIFKISDNTNGWTTQTVTNEIPEGLFPITFDAVVAEATDANAEQTTITTVAAPSITTYQQNHAYTTNEYSIATGKDIYVQVMDNHAVPATLVGTLSATNSLLYAVSDADATEAEVMDALLKRTTELNATDVTGRNGITLTKNTNIDATVTSIVNGVDNNPISVTAGQAAKVAITANGFAAGTYAYVYDYTSGTKTTVEEYQPVAVTAGSVIDGATSTKTFYTLTTTTLNGITDVTAADESVDNDYIYFSKTTNGGATTTYSYISVAGKTTLPAGLIKVAKSSLTTTIAGTENAEAGTFYFDKYITNNGKYAVKVIKVVN